MKNLILLIMLLLGAKNFAQTKGITYQAVILNPSGESLPGFNNKNSPMVDKNICLQFRFIDEFSNVEYQETVKTKTDQFGMVNLVIGSGNQTAGYAASFETMQWNALKKSLIVGINTDGSCSSFTEISDQPFTAVPFAFSAINAGNVTGVVGIQNGGTNAITVVGAKTNLGLENVDNTKDTSKPISTAMVTALSNKVDKVVGKDLSTNDYTTAEQTKLAAITGTNTGDQDLSSYVTNTNLATKVDKVTGERLINNSEISKLSNQSGTNTGDQDLTSFATNTNMALKAPLASPTFTGTVSGIDKTMVGLGNVDNTTDLNKPVSTATQTALDLKASTSDVSTSLALKSNLASPMFTGTPLAPTADAASNNTQIATTAFVSTATTGIFVDLTTAQTIAGAKTFSSDAVVNGITAGKGNGAVASNTAFGSQALKENTIGSSNTAFGTDALKSNTIGFLNTAFGTEALNLNTDGARNTAIGSQALYKNDGFDNTALGYITLQNNTTGSYNVGVGSEVLFNNTTGNDNTALGSISLKANISGVGNTANGYGALTSNTTGSNNTASGSNSLPSNTIGTYNVAYGVQSLEQSTTANQNTAIGVAAIDRNTTGSSNAVLGAFAGRYIADGSTYNTIINNSVLIGAETKPNTDNETNQIVIGYQAKGNGSNTIQLGNSAITSVKTSGTITAGAITYPKIDGTSGQVLSTNGNGIASWSDVSSNASSVVSHSTITSNSIVTIKNLNFRYNNLTKTIEVQTTSGNLHAQVYVTKKTHSATLASSGTINNYRNVESYNTSWKPFINLWNFASNTYVDLITINTYETIEANIHDMGTNTIPVMPNQTYRLFATIDGYNNVLIKVDFAK